MDSWSSGVEEFEAILKLLEGQRLPSPAAIWGEAAERASPVTSTTTQDLRRIGGCDTRTDGIEFCSGPTPCEAKVVSSTAECLLLRRDDESSTSGAVVFGVAANHAECGAEAAHSNNTTDQDASAISHNHALRRRIYSVDAMMSYRDRSQDVAPKLCDDRNPNSSGLSVISLRKPDAKTLTEDLAASSQIAAEIESVTEPRSWTDVASVGENTIECIGSERKVQRSASLLLPHLQAVPRHVHSMDEVLKHCHEESSTVAEQAKIARVNAGPVKEACDRVRSGSSDVSVGARAESEARRSDGNMAERGGSERSVRSSELALLPDALTLSRHRYSLDEIMQHRLEQCATVAAEQARASLSGGRLAKEVYERVVVGSESSEVTTSARLVTNVASSDGKMAECGGEMNVQSLGSPLLPDTHTVSHQRYSVDELMKRGHEKCGVAAEPLRNTLACAGLANEATKGIAASSSPIVSGRRLRYGLEYVMNLKNSPLRSFDVSGLEERRLIRDVGDASPGPARSQREGISSVGSTFNRPDVALTGADQHITFADMLLPAVLLRGLHSAGFHVPSPVQIRGIPLGRLGVDIIAQAKSGTGKTVVFSVLALETVLIAREREDDVAALVLVPTRDIASQIRDVIVEIAAKIVPQVHVGLLIGGSAVRADEAALRDRTHGIIVGTPGRVEDLLDRGSLKLSSLKLLVLDEVDRMLDGSFQGSVPAICNMLPSSKQVVTFSATYSPSLLNTLRTVMRSPELIRLCDDEGSESNICDDDRVECPSGNEEKAQIADLCASSGGGNRFAALQAVRQSAVAIEDYLGKVGSSCMGCSDFLSLSVFDKLQTLVALLSSHPFGQAVVFTNDKVNGRAVKSRLCDAGFAAVYMSGNEMQKTRRASLEAMRRGRARVLVSTDLVARGVDLPGCDLVVHLDLPQDSATYLHRVGRAGRFGSTGTSVVLYFASGYERYSVEHLQRELHCVFEDLSSTVQAIPTVAHGDMPDKGVSHGFKLPVEKSNALVFPGQSKGSSDARHPGACEYAVAGSFDGAERTSNSLSFSRLGTIVTPTAALASASTDDVVSSESSPPHRSGHRHHGTATANDSFSAPQLPAPVSSISQRNVDAEWCTFADSAYTDGYDQGYIWARRLAKLVLASICSQSVREYRDS
jgi:superfamily II DNA/RNA helicase